jgi:hypothetical protein
MRPRPVDRLQSPKERGAGARVSSRPVRPLAIHLLATATRARARRHPERRRHIRAAVRSAQRRCTLRASQAPALRGRTAARQGCGDRLVPACRRPARGRPRARRHGSASGAPLWRDRGRGIHPDAGGAACAASRGRIPARPLADRLTRLPRDAPAISRSRTDETACAALDPPSARTKTVSGALSSNQAAAKGFPETGGRSGSSVRMASLRGKSPVCASSMRRPGQELVA